MFVVTVTLSTCQAEEDFFEDNDPVSIAYKEEIKRYLIEIKLSTNKKKLDKVEDLSNAINPNSLKIYDLNSTQKVLIVDVNNLNGLETSFVTKAIFFLNKNKIIRSRLVTINDTDSVMDKNELILSVLNTAKDKKQYNGIVSFSNPFQEILQKNVYQNGKLVENQVLSSSSNNPNSKTNGCVAWYWVTTYASGQQTWSYLYTICSCEENTYRISCGGNGGGSGSGSGPEFPANPEENKEFDYFSPEGEHIRYQFKNNVWRIVLMSLPEVVVKAKPSTYPYLIFNWPQDQRKVYNAGMVFNFESETNTWNGVILDKVIVDSSFENNPCLKGVYDKLGGAPTFQNYLKEYDGDFSLVDVKLSVGVDSKYPLASAVTYEPINSLIEIKFNPNYLNTPPLNIARTFIHEMIHAETYRKLLILSGKGEIPWSSDFIESIKNDEEKIAHYYMMYKYEIPLGGSPSEPQHEYMAQLSRNIITEVMKQYDSSQSEDVYNALAWIGLMGGGEPDETTGLPPQPTAAWVATPQAERVRILEIYRNFIKNNPKCQ